MLPLFATPWAFAALMAVPTLTALYWLRNSYRQVPVSSLMLWRDLLESRASGLKVRRLRTPLLFFLELAALILLAIAATGPRLEVSEGHWPLVVVLDDSLSMRAGGDRSARVLAQETLERELRWHALGSVRFVLAAVAPQALGDSVDDRRQARDVLGGWTCKALSANLTDALALAAELGGEQARLLVLTDHPPAEELVGGRIVWWAFGEQHPNVALIRAGRTASGEQDRFSLEVANYSAAPRDTTLIVESHPAEQQVIRERLSLAPGETRRLAFRAQGEPGPVRVRLTHIDTLDLDDQAFLVREELPAIRVDTRLTDEGLRGLVDKALLATGKVLPPRTRSHLLITDSAEAPPADPETWSLQIIQEKEAEAYLGPFVLERTHPLTEGLHLAGVVWGAGKGHELVGAPVIMAGNVPLLSDTETVSGQHRLRLRLRADLSTLPQAPAWPILVWNLVHWRAREMPGLRRANLRLGEPAVLSVRPGVERVAVSGPSGTTRTIEARAQRVVVPADEPGIHEIREEGDSQSFAVSTVNAEESDLRTCVTGRWGEWTEEGISAPGLIYLAWAFLLLALAVLTVHLVLATRGLS